MTTQPASAPPDWLYLVAQATQAPSGHNSQPWLFKLNPDSIEVHPDLKRSLPAVDPEHRELYVSLVWCLKSKHQIIELAARATDARMVSALLRHTKGLGSWL